MPVTTLFNGKIYLNRAVRVGNLWQMSLTFSDYNNHYSGKDAYPNHVVYLVDVEGNLVRGVVKSINTKNVSQIDCMVEVDTPVIYIPSQGGGALVEETENQFYPMCPNGISEKVKSEMESYFRWLVDQRTSSPNSGCDGELITRHEIEGTETICLKSIDGTHKKIAASEYREYVLHLKNLDNEEYRLDIDSWGKQMNRATNNTI